MNVTSRKTSIAEPVVSDGGGSLHSYTEEEYVAVLFCDVFEWFFFSDKKITLCGMIFLQCLLFCKYTDIEF
jgi:hypothetical protein